jgi:DMSO/TMAO reductase YedYZ molybdopterin-dependent catalytic subunit
MRPHPAAAHRSRVLLLVVSLLVALIAAPGARAQTRVYSPAFTVDGAVDAPRSYTLADLQAVPAQEVSVEFMSGNARERHVYRGPLLVDLLTAAKPMFDATRRNDSLRWYVTVEATDDYRAVVAWGEIDPGFEGKKVLVAYEADGSPLADVDGMARLVVPGDTRGGRYVSQIRSIVVRPAGGAIGK